MRIIKMLTTFFLIVVVVGAGGFLAAREILLHLGTSSLTSSLKELGTMANSDFFGGECAGRGGQDNISEYDDAVRYQLRFLSSTDYVLEAVCSQFSLTPITINRRALPMFVSKNVGSSGFVWSDLSSDSVELIVFDDLAEKISKYVNHDADFLLKKKAVVVASKDIQVQDSAPPDISGPATSCQGYGYQCCEQSSQIGVGGKMTGATDCSDSCFASCASRPRVLAFNSNPFFDSKTRAITLDSTTTVDFMYIAESEEKQGLIGVVDFGDGQQVNVSGAQGSVSHIYSCQKVNCSYIASIKLLDKWGVESLPTPISKIKVQFMN